MSPLFFKRLSDESLGSRLASGEAAAFDELYRRYSNRLAAYGSHLLGDATSGDDVAQATMLKAYAALREGRVPERVKPWLFRIAHNTAIDLVVRRRELPSGDLPDSPSVDHEPFAGALVEALAALPDRQRRVYVLREVHGLRIDETATELGLTASQVEQSLFAARNRLAEQLVFGDRLNCVTVQRLAAGPLDAPERRALKTHLRTCAGCRQTLGLRGRALSLFPSASGLEWLRGLGAGLLSGGAPAAAKVGALVATATIAAGVPVAVEQSTRGQAQHTTLHLVGVESAAPRATPTVTPAPPDAVPVAARSAVVVPRREAASSDDRRARGERRGDSPEREANRGSTTVEGVGGGDGGSRDSHSGETTTTVSSSGDGGSHDGGSGTDGAVATASPSGSGSGDTSSDGHDATTTTSTTGTQTTSNESSSGNGSTSSDGSGGGSGSGSGSGDHSGESTTTTTVPLLPPPLPVLTVPSGD